MKFLLLLALLLAVAAQANDLQVVIHNCSSPETPDETVASGGCIAGTSAGTSRRLSCLPGSAMCAQLLVYNAPTCVQPFYAGQPSLCDYCTDAHGGTYSISHCNRTTSDLTLSTGCDSTCSSCSGTVYSYPYSTCTSHAAGRMGMYNQGLFPCDGVQVEEFATADCSGSVSASYARPKSDGCFVNAETFACSRPPYTAVATPPAGNMVTYASCPMNSTTCGDECERTSVKAGQCVENPTSARSKYVKMTCGTTAAMCATFSVSSGSACSSIVGQERHACGTCAPWFGGNVYSKLDCDLSGEVVSTSFGCNADCSVCSSAVNHTVRKLGCFVHSSPSNSYTYSLNFQGYAPCATVDVTEYGSDSTCQTATATYPIVRDECDLFYSATCEAESSSRLSGGAIAGIVIGCVAFVAIVVVSIVVCCVCCRKRTEKTVKGSSNGPNDIRSHNSE